MWDTSVEEGIHDPGSGANVALFGERVGLKEGDKFSCQVGYVSIHSVITVKLDA